MAQKTEYRLGAWEIEMSTREREHQLTNLSLNLGRGITKATDKDEAAV